MSLATIGHIALKYAATQNSSSVSKKDEWKFMLSRPAIWVGMICFSFEFLVWLAFLSLISLSEAVLLGTMSMVTIALAGRMIFRERLDSMRLIGISLIALGVVLVGIT
jgi:drug/metabolite transporter (DMT)-like permease